MSVRKVIGDTFIFPSQEAKILSCKPRELTVLFLHRPCNCALNRFLCAAWRSRKGIYCPESGAPWKRVAPGIWRWNVQFYHLTAARDATCSHSLKVGLVSSTCWFVLSLFSIEKNSLISYGAGITPSIVNFITSFITNFITDFITHFIYHLVSRGVMCKEIWHERYCGLPFVVVLSAAQADRCS